MNSNSFLHPDSSNPLARSCLMEFQMVLNPQCTVTTPSPSSKGVRLHSLLRERCFAPLVPRKMITQPESTPSTSCWPLNRARVTPWSVRGATQVFTVPGTTTIDRSQAEPQFHSFTRSCWVQYPLLQRWAMVMDSSCLYSLNMQNPFISWYPSLHFVHVCELLHSEHPTWVLYGLQSSNSSRTWWGILWCHHEMLLGSSFHQSWGKPDPESLFPLIQKIPQVEHLLFSMVRIHQWAGCPPRSTLHCEVLSVRHW
mmetsp:Transcript_28409/g.68257  ORF Transcript_28409/g.68257 Transcript_28409/m.68257 type:complete len:254 (+) Transcript_28409:705-1466(+)